MSSISSSRLYGLALLPIGLMSLYVLFLALILHPTFQAHNVFLHRINFPFHLDLTRPDKIRAIGKGRARNVVVETADKVRISAWQIVPDRYDVTQAPHDERGRAAFFDRALCQSPVVLYFHGNAMNRAAPVRIRAYNYFTRLGFSVVAVDYRGFGDSQGTPSEQGLLLDARAVYKWVLERQQSVHRCASTTTTTGDPNGRQPNAGEIVIAAQSLGTGVASRLTLDLIDVKRAPKATLLMAPYLSIRQLLTSYRIGGVLPLFWPLGLSPFLNRLADEHLYTRFESDKALYVAARGGSSALDADERKAIGQIAYQTPIEDLREQLGLAQPEAATDNTSVAEDDASAQPLLTHIIIAHADDDLIIPHTHGRGLFDRVHDALSLKQWVQKDVSSALNAAVASTDKNDRPDGEVAMADYPWGTLLRVAPSSGQQVLVTLVKSRKGGHNDVPKHALDYLVECISSTTGGETTSDG